MIGADQRLVSDLVTFVMVVSAVASVGNYALQATGITEWLELWGKRFAAFFSVVAFSYWTVNGILLPLLLLSAPLYGFAAHLLIRKIRNPYQPKTQPATPLVEGKGRHSGEKPTARPRWMMVKAPVTLLANVCMAASVFTVFRALSGS